MEEKVKTEITRHSVYGRSNGLIEKSCGSAPCVKYVGEDGKWDAEGNAPWYTSKMMRGEEPVPEQTEMTFLCYGYPTYRDRRTSGFHNRVVYDFPNGSIVSICAKAANRTCKSCALDCFTSTLLTRTDPVIFEEVDYKKLKKDLDDGTRRPTEATKLACRLRDLHIMTPERIAELPSDIYDYLEKAYQFGPKTISDLKAFASSSIPKVLVGDADILKNLKPDKAQALKPLEEASEVFGAWQKWKTMEDHELPSDEAFEEMMSECADTIQAVCSLAASFGVTDLTRYMEDCHDRNAAKGRL